MFGQKEAFSLEELQTALKTNTDRQAELREALKNWQTLFDQARRRQMVAQAEVLVHDTPERQQQLQEAEQAVADLEAKLTGFQGELDEAGREKVTLEALILAGRKKPYLDEINEVISHIRRVCEDLDAAHLAGPELWRELNTLLPKYRHCATRLRDFGERLPSPGSAQMALYARLRFIERAAFPGSTTLRFRQGPVAATTWEALWPHGAPEIAQPG
jgi:chromosome segregation ATPase